MQILLSVIGFVVLVVALGLLLAWPMSYLWNLCLLPAVPALREVGVLQMWGINVLIGLWLHRSSSKKD